MGVLDAHHAALDAQDAVALVAELEDVAGHALDREILVHGADDVVLRLEQHLVVGVVGDGAAGGERGEPRAAPAAQHVVDGVVVDQRAAPAAPGAEAFRQHAHDGREILARQLAIGPGAADAAHRARPRPIRAPPTSATICCASTSSGCSGIASRSSSPRRTLSMQRRAFDQLVARERKQPALGRAVDGMAGAPDALQEARDRARRADLADQVDLADVDAELERGGRHQRLELAVLEPLLGVEPLLLGEAAVVRGHVRPRRAARTDAGSPARPGGAC